MRAVIFSIAAACVLLPARAQAHPAWGIAVDRQGQVYFSDLKTIWKIDAQGELSIFRAGKDHTHDLNVDDAGNLYGAENSYDPATERFFSAIWKMTAAGSFSYLLDPTDHPPIGTSIWKDCDGNAYHVANYPEGKLLVLKRTLNGNVTVVVGNSNAARNYHQGVPYSAGGMAFGADGSLYFTHGSNVSKVTSGGILTPLARNVVVENASGGRPERSPLFGIAVDAEGNALVADHGNRRILKIAPDGQLSTLVRAEEPWFPTGVARRGSELYILEESHTPASIPIGTRVRQLSPDGTMRVLATVGENKASAASPSTSETSSGENSETARSSKRNVSYVLIGAAMGVFVLTVIIWRARTR